MQNFLAAMRRQIAPIHQQLNWLMQAQIDENREKMKSIVKIVVFCGQNNIPLMGKRDDNPDDSNLQGTFQAPLESRIDSGVVRTFLHFELKTYSRTKQFLLPWACRSGTSSWWSLEKYLYG